MFNASQRKRKAYLLFFSILFSYFFLWLLRKIFGKQFARVAWERKHEKNAKRLTESLLDLKGLYIKAGQLLSMLGQFLPKVYITQLEQLQDDTYPSDIGLITQAIENHIGKPIKEVFMEFPETPIASASIGQVHKARLHDGTAVAVKIKHPHVDALAEMDLDVIGTMVGWAGKLFHIGGLSEAWQEIKTMIFTELDYRHEAEAMETIRANCKEMEGIVIPHLYQEYSGKNVLVTRFCEGVKINQKQQLESWGLDVDEICDRLVLVFSEMIFTHGFYHADPHPGNVRVNEEGDLILLDFGATAVLSAAMKDHIPLMVQAIAMNDKKAIFDCLNKMGISSRAETSEETIYKIIDSISELLQSDIRITEVQPEEMIHIHKKHFDQKFNIKEVTEAFILPKDWFLLQRTIILIYGVVGDISTDYDPMQTVRPFMRRIFLKRENLQSFLLTTAKSKALESFQIPTKLNRFLDQQEKQINGGISAKPNGLKELWSQLVFFFMATAMAMVSHLGKQAFYEKLFVCWAVLGLLFLVRKVLVHSPKKAMAPLVSFYGFAAITLLIFAFVSKVLGLEIYEYSTLYLGIALMVVYKLKQLPSLMR